jgi:hypothetical protein
MHTKPLIAALFAAAFALPMAASANQGKTAGDKTAATQSSAADGGAEAMFKSMDKNGDGFISKEEAAGTPHAKDFAKLDKNADGKLSREEHAAAPEHAKVASNADKPATTASTDTSSTSGKKAY